MISEYFGKPSLPTILQDCLLIIDGKVQFIGKVYFFSNTRTLTVRDFGGEWPTDVVVDKRKFCGYFSCNFNPKIGLPGQLDTEYIIQSSADYPIIYKLNNVVFSRIRNISNRSTSRQFIKFSCLSFDIIRKNSQE